MIAGAHVLYSLVCLKMRVENLNISSKPHRVRLIEFSPPCSRRYSRRTERIVNSRTVGRIELQSDSSGAIAQSVPVSNLSMWPNVQIFKYAEELDLPDLHSSLCSATEAPRLLPLVFSCQPSLAKS